MRLLQEFLYDDRKMVCDVIDSGVPEMTYTEVSTLIAARATTQRTIEDTGKVLAAVTMLANVGASSGSRTASIGELYAVRDDVRFSYSFTLS